MIYNIYTMIFWIASYPKSGNTWLRALISSYYYTNNGLFNANIIKQIGQFPEKRHFVDFNFNKNVVADTSRFWIEAQKKINLNNKINFFKTHNAFGALNNNQFTNKENSIGAIYVIRDPRNVITSIKNHYELNSEQALKWMINENNYIYDVSRFDEDGYSDFQFVSSWSTNYKSWTVQKKIPVKIIKYEDLLNKTYAVFKEVVDFINKTTNNNEKINKDKLKNSVNSTSFNKLRENEQKNGFSEAITSKKNNKKIPFFYLGPKNDWKKILDEELKIKLNDVFKKNLVELSYN